MAKPKLTEPQSIEQKLALFRENLNAMRLWYRRTHEPGPEAGVYVMHELILAQVLTALDLATEGKKWVAPTPTP